MGAKKVEEITRVIGTLTQEELEEGRLDSAVQSALDDEKHGRVRPL